MELGNMVIKLGKRFSLLSDPPRKRQAFSGMGRNKQLTPDVVEYYGICHWGLLIVSRDTMKVVHDFDMKRTMDGF